MGIVTGVRGVRNAKKDYKKEKKDRVKKYTNYIDRKKNEIDQARQEEKDILCDKYISERQEIGRLKNFHTIFLTDAEKMKIFWRFDWELGNAKRSEK